MRVSKLGNKNLFKASNFYDKVIFAYVFWIVSIWQRSETQVRTHTSANYSNLLVRNCVIQVAGLRGVCRGLCHHEWLSHWVLGMLLPDWVRHHVLRLLLRSLMICVHHRLSWSHHGLSWSHHGLSRSHHGLSRSHHGLSWSHLGVLVVDCLHAVAGVVRDGVILGLRLVQMVL